MARGKMTGNESADATSLSRAIGARDESVARAGGVRGSGSQANDTFGGNKLRKLGNTNTAGGIAKSESQKIVARGNNLAANRAGSNRLGGPGATSTNRAVRSPVRTGRGRGITGAVSPLGGRASGRRGSR